MPFKFIDEEAIERQILANRAAIRREQEQAATYLDAAAISALAPGGAPRRFNALSLEAWLALAQRAGVAFVPARRLAVLHGRETMGLLDGIELSPEAAGAMRTLRDALATLGEDEIVRWDYACGSAIKSMMARGAGWRDPATRQRGYMVHGGRRLVEVDDVRLMEMMLPYCSDRIPVHARPWLPAASIPGLHGGEYPIEWRVYCDGGRVEAVSAYYPQADILAHRPLDACLEGANTAAALARLVIAVADRLALTPANPHTMPEPAGFSGTLDFIERAADGALVLIEGGTSLNGGAHPCCFFGAGDECRPVEGIAFSAAAPPLPLD